MTYDSLIIVTYGRSGSTLLQGVLNAIDGCLIRGENFNFCFHLFNAYTSIKRSKDMNGSLPNDPWYGAGLLSDAMFVESMKALVKSLILADKSEEDIRCYGFKEIRFFDVMDQLRDYINFLELIFPNLAFVCNTRNISDVVRSGWWKERDSVMLSRKMYEFQGRMLEFIMSKPNAFHIRYEDIISMNDRLRSLFDFLGAEYDEKLVKKVLMVEHSYDNRRRSS